MKPSCHAAGEASPAASNTRARPARTPATVIEPPAPPAAPIEWAPPPAPIDNPAADTPFADYRPVAGQRTRHDGWTADRQRTFLTVLAESGCISLACAEAGASSRSAYRLRQRADAASFAQAWDQALRLATLRLTTVAFERAVRGTVREFWREGERVGETRTPSDRLLVFLLGHLLPRGADQPSRLDAFDRALAPIQASFPAALDALTDHPVDLVPINSRDFFGVPPGDPTEDW